MLPALLISAVAMIQVLNPKDQREPADSTYEINVDVAGAEEGDTWALFYFRSVDGSTDMQPIVLNAKPEQTSASWNVGALPTGVYQIMGVLLHQGEMITAPATGTVFVRH